MCSKTNFIRHSSCRNCEVLNSGIGRPLVRKELKVLTSAESLIDGASQKLTCQMSSVQSLESSELILKRRATIGVTDWLFVNRVHWNFMEKTSYIFFCEPVS